jgi:hypothetical protein
VVLVVMEKVAGLLVLALSVACLAVVVVVEMQLVATKNN